MTGGPDLAAAITALGRFFRAVDVRDWPAVTAGLADPVTTDYTSVFGGTPETVPREELVTRWRGLLPGFDATQHLLGPPVALEPSKAGAGRLGCNVRGYHHLDGQTWMVAGWYTLTLTVGDSGHGPVRIAGIELDMSYETGSRELVDLAQSRATARH